VVQEDSYKNYFVIFEHSYKFLRILEVCPIFLEFKIIKNELKFAAQCWAERRLAIVRGEARRPATRNRLAAIVAHSSAVRRQLASGKVLG
jgi:hypothetical protein